MALSAAFNVSAATWTAKKGIREVPIADPSALLDIQEGVTWLALTVTEPLEARRILRDGFGFHPVAIEDALSDKERPGAYVDDHYLFVTIPLVEVKDGELCYTHLGIFVCPHVLVSVTTLGSNFIEEWFRRWKAHPAEVGQRTDMLMQEIFDAAVDDYFPALDVIQDQVDFLEETVYAGKAPPPATAVRLRRKLLEMRRQVTPIRDMLNTLLRRDIPIVEKEARTYLQDVYDHSLRVLEGIDLNRDILTSIMDAQLSVQSNRLNEVMKNMTSLATILMMMALVTGVYGMNFDHMPELRWKYGYLYVLLALLVILVGGLAFARKIGWFTVRWPWEGKDPE